MFIGRPPGNYDRLLDFSRAVTGNLFFVPSATFLESVTGDQTDDDQTEKDQPAVAETAATPRRLIPLHPSHRCATVRSALVLSKEIYDMNNFIASLPHFRLGMGSDREEASRTLKRYLADGASSTCTDRLVSRSPLLARHLRTIAARRKASSRASGVKALVELRVPFELSRQSIDDVDRGANDSDWQPAKDAARQIAFAEDAAIFDGYAAAGIGGIRQGTSNPIMTLPPMCANIRMRLRRA